MRSSDPAIRPLCSAAAERSSDAVGALPLRPDIRRRSYTEHGEEGSGGGGKGVMRAQPQPAGMQQG